MSIEVMKQALEALECLFGVPERFTGDGGGDVAVWTLGGSFRSQQAITALRQAIEDQQYNYTSTPQRQPQHSDFEEYCKTLHPLWNSRISRTEAEGFFHAGWLAAHGIGEKI